MLTIRMKLVPLTLCAVLTCAIWNIAEGKEAVRAKRFKVDLHEDPTKRWIPVLQNFDGSMVLDVVNSMLSEYVRSKELIALAQIIAKDLDRYLPQPFADEIRGIAKFYDIKLGDIVLGNLAYDVSAWDTTYFRACTSIVTLSKNGGLLHARNLDYPFSDALRNITIEVEFHRSGKTEYVGTTYVGYVGLLTAAKPNAFSLTGDQRNTGYWWENFLFALKGSWPTLMLTRQVLTDAWDFDSAVSILEKQNTISPMYLIIGGIKPHEGAIVVRDRWGAINVTRMTDTSHSWFVVETNYDPWKKPPASDDRRDPAVKAMEHIGQMNMDSDRLYQVLSTPPVFNADTTYTTIMSAGDMSEYRTMIRWDRPTKGGK